MRLLVTRPLHQAAPTVAALEQDGHACIVSPMLNLHDLDLPQPSGNFDIIVLTSRNAVDGLARQWPANGRDDWPIYCVGDTTRDSAVEAGFTKAVSCEGSAHDLVEQVTAVCEKGLAPEALGRPNILYPCALQPAHDLPALFAERELTCAAWPVYAMEDAEAFTPEAERALNEGKLDGVLLYSARSAKVFAKLVSRLEMKARPPTIFTLSGNICAVLPPDLAASCIPATEPNEAMLRLVLAQHRTPA